MSAHRAKVSSRSMETLSVSVQPLVLQFGGARSFAAVSFGKLDEETGVQFFRNCPVSPSDEQESERAFTFRSSFF